MTSLLQQQQRVLDDLTTSVQDLRVDVRKTQTSPQAATNVLSGSAPGAATAGARHNLDSGSVDSIEDLGRLLAENADLDRLVTKVREAQQHLVVKNTRVVVPLGATLDSTLDEQDAMRKVRYPHTLYTDTALASYLTLLPPQPHLHRCHHTYPKTDSL